MDAEALRAAVRSMRGILELYACQAAGLAAGSGDALPAPESLQYTTVRALLGLSDCSIKHIAWVAIWGCPGLLDVWNIVALAGTAAACWLSTLLCLKVTHGAVGQVTRMLQQPQASRSRSGAP